MNTYDKIVKYSGYLASALFIMIGFIVSYEVIMRYIFNSPTIWVNEISRFLQIWATYLALTYTCLLYTSPSPRDATLSRMPSSA